MDVCLIRNIYCSYYLNVEALIFECISEGEAQMISLLTCTVIHNYKFKQQVNAIKFSPDGKYFAACCDDTGKASLVKHFCYTYS